MHKKIAQAKMDIKLEAKTNEAVTKNIRGFRPELILIEGPQQK
jgi:hypothetical protein